MGTISEKLTYLNETKQELKQAINNLGGEIDNNTTFREYVEELQDIYDNLPKTSYGEGTNISLANTLKGKLDFDNLLYGDTSQDGTPTPDTPIDIQVVTGTQEVKIVGKNLFTNTIYEDIDYTGNPELQDTGYYKIRFPNEKNIYESQFKENTQYTLSFYGYYPSGTGNGGVFRFIYTDGTNSQVGITSTTPTKYTLTSTSGKTISKIYITWGNSAYNFVKELMLELGSTATTYSPYTSESYTLHLRDLELAKIGSYQDKIYYDNGKWYLRKEIGTFRPTSIFRVYSNGMSGVKMTASSNPEENYYSTHFAFGGGAINSTTSYNYGDNKFSVNNQSDGADYGKLFYFRSDNITTESAWNTFFTNNNVYIYYVLATPTLTEITDTTLIEELNSLYNAYSYSGTTNIQVEGTLAGGLKVRALKGE